MSEVVLEGRYALGRQLGAGGFAYVYDAVDLKLGRSVAVKLVPPGHPAPEEASGRLEREGRIAGALAHPNICAVTDVGRQPGGTPYLVLERLVGETLADRLARLGRLPPDLAVEVAGQLLVGLAFAHGARVVHRDVSPANIFLVDVGAGRPLVKLLDFGLAQDLGAPVSEGSLTRTGVAVGTLAYMCPEQARGRRDLDARADVYASAVVLYEMLSGRRPFGDLGPRDFLEAVAHRKAPPLAPLAPEAPPVVLRAVDTALNVDRQHRFRDARVFLDRLTAPDEAAAATSGDPWDLSTTQGPPPRDD